MDDTEQQIEVPKISCPDRPHLCAVLSATLMAEQLVDVSWVSPSSIFKEIFILCPRTEFNSSEWSCASRFPARTVFTGVFLWRSSRLCPRTEFNSTSWWFSRHSLGAEFHRSWWSYDSGEWSLLAEHHEEVLPVAPAVAWSTVTGLVAFSCLALVTLGFWTFFLRARVSGKRLRRCFGVNPRLLSEEFQLSLGDSTRAVRTWKSGQLATLFAQYLARQWIQVHRLFLEAFGRISSVVFVKVNSDPAVNSRPALLGFFGSCSLEKCAQSLLRFRGLPELVALGIWTLFSRAPSC